MRLFQPSIGLGTKAVPSNKKPQRMLGSPANLTCLFDIISLRTEKLFWPS